MLIDRRVVAGIIATLAVGSGMVGAAMKESSLAAAISAVNQDAGTIVDVAKSAGQFRTMLDAATAAGLVETLNGAGPFTIFAPTDEAFGKLDQHALSDLRKPENRERLKAILTYHVVPGRIACDEAIKAAVAGGNATTVNGQRAMLTLRDGRLRIGDSSIIKADVEATNGIIHVIDKVLIPAKDDLAQTATKAGRFKTLLVAAKAARLVEALKGSSPLTVFAPTDEAFAKLPAGLVERLVKPEHRETLKAILLYHVAQGRVYADQALAQGSVKSLQGSSGPM